VILGRFPRPNVPAAVARAGVNQVSRVRRVIRSPFDRARTDHVSGHRPESASARSAPLSHGCRRATVELQGDQRRVFGEGPLAVKLGAILRGDGRHIRGSCEVHRGSRTGGRSARAGGSLGQTSRLMASQRTRASADQILLRRRGTAQPTQLSRNAGKDRGFWLIPRLKRRHLVPGHGDGRFHQGRAPETVVPAKGSGTFFGAVGAGQCGREPGSASAAEDARPVLDEIACDP